MIVGSGSSVDRLPLPGETGITVLNDDNAQSIGVARVEPSADIRGMAGFCRQFYVALLDQLFTPDQALDLVGRAVQGATTNVDVTQ